jgi:hypothetical protein
MEVIVKQAPPWRRSGGGPAAGRPGESIAAWGDYAWLSQRCAATSTRAGYLAGDDATRARELMDAFADPETTAVWCPWRLRRGGSSTKSFDVIRRNRKYSSASATSAYTSPSAAGWPVHVPRPESARRIRRVRYAAGDGVALWHTVMAQSKPQITRHTFSQMQVCNRCRWNRNGSADRRQSGGSAD